ncbi:multidrug ABC transporter permease protein [Ligilactobacillus salitolerans]|uniref:Multidrug ABC transporter permease protein n=1 Tax=Ligilactobacillus salitolerans TaxID=1808352 RepID=A0A401ISH0_9LACO|nr:ABC transporter permease [Ligilactobacillus salitolerans]GBG94479.1 multidrug ABC transporter permease protein [Ligilactobacillus salitolerans]
MNELWKKRRASYQQKLLKYLRFVFNDHFVIALLFLFGAAALSYSNFLKSLSPQSDLWWAKPLAALILLFLLHSNQLATLLKKPDPVFLLPREQGMRDYFKAAFQHSATVVGTVQVVYFCLLLPFLLLAAHLSLASSICLGLTQLVLAIQRIEQQGAAMYLPLPRNWKWQVVFAWLLPAVILAGGLYLSSLLSLILALILAGTLRSLQKVKLAQSPLDWRYANTKEDGRQSQLARFFNMFTDVATLSPQPKRRRYLDRLLPQAKPSSAGFFKYLFWRGFLRSGEYSSLYLRLTFLCWLILFFLPNYWLALAIAALFIYLIAFQLLPIYMMYDEVVFMHTYPINIQNKFKAFSWVLFSLLLASTILFTIPLATQGFGLVKTLLGLLLLLVESWLLARIYSKLRLKKIA